MNYYIKEIKINEIHHLRNFSINIPSENTPHLLITGENGTGKTILLNAIAKFMGHIVSDNRLDYLEYGKKVTRFEQIVCSTPKQEIDNKGALDFYRERKVETFGEVDITYTDVYKISKDYHEGNFIFAFYKADRKPQMKEVVNPVKPDIYKKRGVADIATPEFIKFLVDLKVQEALARNENMIGDADNIRYWFESFEALLAEIYNDTNLKILFNYKDYSFRIETGGKLFKFTELSDGFAAVIDIVSDLILKMQQEHSLVRTYDKRGIVLIDEIETHLHLGLQKVIMPILTKMFPNIQFIVTTHSPFVLNSLSNAVAFDMEHKKCITDLNEYSYEALAEGYFGVNTSSSYLEMRINQLAILLQKSTFSPAETVEIKRLLEDLGSVSEAVSPLIVGQFNELRLQYAHIIRGL